MAWCGRRWTSRLAQPRCRLTLGSDERGVAQRPVVTGICSSPDPFADLRVM